MRWVGGGGGGGGGGASTCCDVIGSCSKSHYEFLNTAYPVLVDNNNM